MIGNHPSSSSSASAVLVMVDSQETGVVAFKGHSLAFDAVVVGLVASSWPSGTSASFSFAVVDLVEAVDCKVVAEGCVGVGLGVAMVTGTSLESMMLVDATEELRNLWVMELTHF